MSLMSPPPSSMSPSQPRRRLSSRRGSMTASDPYAKHTEDHPDRSSFSTLTIVRVPPQQHQAEQFPLNEPPSQRRHHNHARTGSGGRAPNPASPGGGSGRLSFAFSTFAPPGGGQGRGERSTSPSTSPSSSPRLRPSSPHRLSSSGSTASKPRLSADQLYEVAHRSTNPGYLNSAHQNDEHKNATFTPLPPAVYLPFIDRPSEIAALISTPPTKKLFALLSQTFPKRSSESQFEKPVPPSNMTLDDIPSDPTKWNYPHLITFATQATRSIAPDALFVALLRKCILNRSELIWERVKGALGVPPELDIDLDVDFNVDEEGNVFDSSSSEGGAGSDAEDGGMKAKGHWEGWDTVIADSPAVEKNVLPSPPAKDKEKNPEEEFKAQIDAALTAPPRVKAISMDRLDSSGSGQTTISPTPRPRNSPPRKHKTLLSDVPSTDADGKDLESSIPKIITEEPTPNPSQDSFESVVSRKSHLKNRPGRSSSLSSWLGSTVASPTGEEPEPTWSPSTPGDFGSNIVDFGLNASTDDDEESGGGSPVMKPSTSVDVLSIEPLVSSPSLSMLSPGNHPPPLSLEGGGGGEGALGDIIEGEEDEDDAGGAESEEKQKEKEKEKRREALRINGLRFSLSPTLSTPGSPVMGSPNHVFWSNGGSRNGSATSSPVIASKRPLSWGSSSSRRSSFGAGSPGGGLTRTGSSGSLTGMAIQLSSMDTGGSLSRSGSFGSIAQATQSGGYRYDPVGDRVPGNPLFPSNFARLTSGPTLAANNPSLRSKAMPPPPRFSRPPLGLGLGLRRNSNTSMSDYAITVASESAGGSALNQS